MLKYLTLIISAVLAVIGSLLNTQKEEKGDPKPLFKKLNGAGLMVISLLIGSFFIQFILQFRTDTDDRKKYQVDERRRLEDSFNIQRLLKKTYDDSISWQRQFGLLDTSYKKQMLVLANSDSLLDKSNSLLEPIYPMVILIKLKIPVNHPGLNGYFKRFLFMKDSLNKEGLLEDEMGIEPSYYEDKKRTLRGYYIDTSSNCYGKGLDRMIHFFSSLGFNIYFYNKKPTFPLLYKHFSPSDFTIFTKKYRDETSRRFSSMGEEVFFNVVDSTFEERLCFAIDFGLHKERIVSTRDLLNKWMVLIANNPGSYGGICSIASVILCTGPNYDKYLVLKLPRQEKTEYYVRGGDTVDCGLQYLHKIDDEDFKRKYF